MSDLEKVEAIIYKIALRAKALADMTMPVLRKVVEPDVSCTTRGAIIEWAIIEEFSSAAKPIDEFVQEADRAIKNHDWN